MHSVPDVAAAVICSEMVVRTPLGGELESGENVVVPAIDIVPIKVHCPANCSMLATRVAHPAATGVIPRHSTALVLEVTISLACVRHLDLEALHRLLRRTIDIMELQPVHLLPDHVSIRRGVNRARTLLVNNLLFALD